MEAFDSSTEDEQRDATGAVTVWARVPEVPTSRSGSRFMY
jgi:hypothetical protein